MDYISLEDLSNRIFAQDDPKGFLQRFDSGVVLDEIQRVPSLLSYIQGIVDEKNQNGLFILTGSQQLELMDSINQSLAGRTAMVKLLPLSYQEIYQHDGAEKKPSLKSVLYTGFYPRIFKEGLNPTEMYSLLAPTWNATSVPRSMYVILFCLRIFSNFLNIPWSNNIRTNRFLNNGTH